MNIALTPELEKLISQKVAEGQYASLDEALQEAIRLLLELELRDPLPPRELHEEIARGLLQEQQGRVKPFDAEDLKRRVRERVTGASSA